MRKARKLLALIMAMVTVFAMTAMPVSATVTFPYLTVADGTAYTTQVTTSYTTLSVQKYGSDWNEYVFDFSELQHVKWTWPDNGSNNFTFTANSEPHGTGYYATLDIKAKNDAVPGAYRIRATYEDNILNPYIDLIVVVAASSAQTANITVEIIAPGSSGFTASNSVTASAGTYNYATPLKSLDAMIGTTAGTSINTYAQSGGYVNSITGYNNTTSALVPVANNWNTGYGWQYRVYHKNGTTYMIDSKSEYYGADAFRLIANDYVKWVYCTYNDISTYFPSSFSPTP